MYKKSLTNDCENCKFCIMNEQEHLTCTWGHNPKLLNPKKGKKYLTCNLIRPKQDKIRR